MGKGVIFDFNGTLFFDSHIHLIVWEEIYKELFNNSDNFKDIFNEVIGSKNIDIIKHFFKVNGIKISDEETEKISLRKEKKYRDYCIENNLCKLAPGSKRVLDYFKNNNYKMNLSSASIKENIDFFFDYFGIGEYFKKELVTYDNGEYHNKEKMYIDAAKNIDIDLAESYIFEDSIYGATNAYEAGCNKIIMIDPDGSKPMIDGVICKCSSYDEIDLNIFEK